MGVDLFQNVNKFRLKRGNLGGLLGHPAAVGRDQQETRFQRASCFTPAAGGVWIWGEGVEASNEANNEWWEDEV